MACAHAIAQLSSAYKVFDAHLSKAASVIQATERDEFSYQEMITHLPLCALKEGLPEPPIGQSFRRVMLSFI
eukprot:1157751-Pelagomonas_calceolata.AAC.2